jgi:hypothetical protein
VSKLTSAPALFAAAAYAVILAVVLAYYAVSARRVAALQRGVDLLKSEVEKREAAGSGD